MDWRGPDASKFREVVDVGLGPQPTSEKLVAATSKLVEMAKTQRRQQERTSAC
ncbi:MAG: hypothetical protein IPF88_04675 [Candidatus Microthrix sp.]|nr:hypothetical protein [Candidatus Microthrix sp.]MBK6437892.1 hypothetical protein [Candidatus Microthrix sp.]